MYNITVRSKIIMSDVVVMNTATRRHNKTKTFNQGARDVFIRKGSANERGTRAYSYNNEAEVIS